MITCTQNNLLWAIDGQVQGPGYSLSVVPSFGAYSLLWSSGNKTAILGSQSFVGLKMRYTTRNQNLASSFYELQYQRYNWTGLPAPKRLSSSSQNSFGAFAGQRSSSLNRIWLGYSLGATEEFFVSSSTSRLISLEKRIVYHGRLSASVIIWTPRFGNNPTATKNIAPKDSPKVRVEFTGGALSPYKEKMISKYWGWEGIGQLIYGNSIQWISLQYELSDQINSQSRHRRDALKLEFSLSLDQQKQRDKGTGW